MKSNSFKSIVAGSLMALAATQGFAVPPPFATRDVNVVNTPDVNIVGTPGVTVENDSSNPVPVEVETPLQVESAYPREPFILTEGGSPDGSYCRVNLSLPFRSVVEVISFRANYSGTARPVATFAFIKSGEQQGSFSVDLQEYETGSTWSYEGTTSLRLYPPKGGTLQIFSVGSDGTSSAYSCQASISGYKIPDDSPSLSP